MLTRSGIKIPKLVRSVFATGIIFLLIMSFLRIALFLCFNRQGTHFSDAFPAFVLGLRYDLRDVAILCLLLLILGSIPALDPFKGGTGPSAGPGSSRNPGARTALFLTGLAENKKINNENKSKKN